MEFGAGVFEPSDKRYQQLLKLIENTAADTSSGSHYFGLPQWGVREWRECFYPQGLATSKYLQYYSRYLNCVELSSTFYTRVSDEQIRNWCDQVGEGFNFLPKWPKLMTHTKSLQNCSGEIRDFLGQLEIFGDHLGTSILQLPPNFSRDFNRELYYFLQQVPKGVALAIELRHSSWFENGSLYSKLTDYLRENNIGTVICDTPGRPDLFHTTFSTGMSVVRFLSDEVSDHDKWRLSQWREYLRGHSQDIAICIHRPNNEGTPKMLEHLEPELWHSISADRVNGESQNLKLF